MNGNNQQGGPESRTRIIIEGAMERGAPAIDKRESTLFGEDGLQETLTIRLRYADGCFHLVQTAGHIGGICSNPSCLRALCIRCATSDDHLCYFCRKPSCGDCLREVEIDGEKEVVCRQCYRRRFYWQGIAKTAAWVFLIFAAVFLLRNLL